MVQNNQQNGNQQSGNQQSGNMDKQQRNNVSDSGRSSQSSDLGRDDDLQNIQQSGNLQSGRQQGNRQLDQDDALLNDNSADNAADLRNGASQQQARPGSQGSKNDKR